MALLEWKDEYSTGIEDVDDEHRDLIDIVNRLHGLMLAEDSKLTVPAFFDGLIKGVSAHFALEERIMDESGYPGFEAYAWWGIFAPAGTPKLIIERFSNEMAATLREERIAKQLIETQQVSLTLGGPEIQRKFVANQMQVWGKVVKDNNIKAD